MNWMEIYHNFEADHFFLHLAHIINKALEEQDSGFFPTLI